MGYYEVTILSRDAEYETTTTAKVKWRPSNRKLRGGFDKNLVLTSIRGEKVAVPFKNIRRISVNYHR